MRSTLLIIALCTACYSPAYEDCLVTCATSQTCPSGLTCVSGHCVADETVSCTVTLPSGPWSSPTAVLFGGMPTTLHDDPTLTEDMLEIWVHSLDSSSDIYTARRGRVTDPWPALVKVDEISANSEISPEVSSDGLTMYFARSPTNEYNIQETMRPSRSAQWAIGSRVDSLNTTSYEGSSAVSHDGLTIVLASARAGSSDIYITTRASLAGVWPMPAAVPALAKPTFGEDCPFLLSDNLTIYFAANFGNTNTDLYKSTRPPGGAFGNPVAITELNTPGDEYDPWVSPDGRTIYFGRNSTGVSQIMTATRGPE